jgi:hypothetical protein
MRPAPSALLTEVSKYRHIIVVTEKQIVRRTIANKREQAY